MATPRPILKISDGTSEVDLLDRNGILLMEWVPNLAENKGGGAWADPPFVPGRHLVHRVRTSISDSFELKIVGRDQDEAILKLRNLRALLEKGVNYWLSDAQNTPVYIVARGPYETNTRYAILIDYKTPSDSNPFAQPFFSRNALVNNFLLGIEHGQWQDIPPGQSTCVEIEAQQEYAGAVSSGSYAPAASSDDASITGGAIDLTSTWLNFTSDTENGIRFVNVTIPAGATIVSARVDFVSVLARSDNYCHVLIEGEDTDDAATFSNYADYIGRTRTSARTSWPALPALVDGQAFSTPDLKTIIQEIVDRGGWASGQDIALFFTTSGTAQRSAASIDHTDYDPATLRVQWTTGTAITYGREVTCNSGEVFVVNKHNRANLTHVYAYDASLTSFSANLIGAATPFAFLPATPAAGDIAYFGIGTAIGDSGPFNNLVFDISTAQVDCTTIVWEYYNGAAWATLAVQDNTATTDPFDRAGVHSVHWAQPSNWTATAINGVTAFWVRARVTVVGAAPTPPEQDNRDIYSVVWPCVAFESDQTGGDIPALARILATNQSDAASGNPVLHTNRLMVASRSASRGTKFTPFLNFAQEQNPPGVTVTVSGVDTTFATNAQAPIGQDAFYDGSGADTEIEATITLDDTIAPDYLGQFRAFLRYQYVTGNANELSFRLITTPGGSGLAQYSGSVYPQVNTDFQLADFGIVNIPSDAPTDEYGSITFEIEITATGAGKIARLYDLILLPVDEWMGDFADKSGLAARTGAAGNDDLLDMDNVTHPRQGSRAILRDVASGRKIGIFQARTGEILVQANADQCLWFLAVMYESGTELSAPPSLAHTVQVYAVRRYLSMRGNG